MTARPPRVPMRWKQTEDGESWYFDFYNIQTERCGDLERKFWSLRFAGERLNTYRFLFQAKHAAYKHRKRQEAQG